MSIETGRFKSERSSTSSLLLTSTIGSREIEDAAKHLIELKNKVNTKKMREPSFLMVLTGTEIAYRRKDGVLVVPIGCLRN